VNLLIIFKGFEDVFCQKCDQKCLQSMIFFKPSNSQLFQMKVNTRHKTRAQTDFNKGYKEGEYLQ